MDDPIGLIYVASGALAFVLLLWFDWAAMRRMRVIKQLIWYGGGALLSFSVIMAVVTSEKIIFPRLLVLTGWVLSAMFFALLLYSLFFEIPLSTTYASAGSPKYLVTTGTYALSRHPGVLWFAGLLGSLFLASGASLLLVAAPVWIILDTAYVIVQDRIYFPRIFGEAYARYRKEVPMLIPTRSSIRRCLRTLRRPG